MVYTNPGGISNSGAVNFFTNQKGQIHKLNLNIIINGDSQYYNYFNSQNNGSYSSNASQSSDYTNVLIQQKLSSRFGKLKSNID